MVKGKRRFSSPSVGVGGLVLHSRAQMSDSERTVFVFMASFGVEKDEPLLAALRERYGEKAVLWCNGVLPAPPRDGTIFVIADTLVKLGIAAVNWQHKSRRLWFVHSMMQPLVLTGDLAPVVAKAEGKDVETVLYEWFPPANGETITAHPTVVGALVIKNPHLPFTVLDEEESFRWLHRAKAVYKRNRAELPPHHYATLVIDKKNPYVLIILFDVSFSEEDKQFFARDPTDRYYVCDLRPYRG